MPYVERKRRPYAVWEKVRPWVTAFAIMAAIGVFFRFLATRGPRGVGRAAEVEMREGGDPALVEIAGQVSVWETEWRRVTESEGGSAAGARTALLRAVELQREFVRRDARASVREAERLRGLEQALATLDVREKAARVAVLEREAEAAHGAGKTAEAVATLREALAAQEAINRTHAAESVKDFPREGRLRLAMETLEAEPLGAVVARARAAAEVAMTAQRWDEARTAFTEARAAQGRINREFGRTRFADGVAEAWMAGEIASLAAAAIAQGIEDRIARAEVAAAAGRREEAGTLFGEARDAQEQVNSQHPQSRFVSALRAEELETRRQTELSAGPLAKLERLDAAVAEALRARDMKGARARIAELVELAAETWKTFPLSRELPGALRERGDFLAARSAGLAAIQEDVLGQLVVLPGGAGRMLESEVPQSLYALIMDTNPSRQAGEARAVDSVNWGDAREFCRRLGWALGRAVRLPSEAEFCAALAVPGGRFKGLRSELAEWLDATPGELVAPVAGGDAQAGVTSEAEVAVAPRAKSERGRQLGFRIVVE